MKKEFVVVGIDKIIVDDKAYTFEEACIKYPKMKDAFYAEKYEFEKLVNRAYEDAKNYSQRKSNIPATSLNLSQKIDEINKKVDEIFKKLEIKPAKNNINIKDMFKLFKYVIENSKYDENIMNEKTEEKQVNNLNGLVVNDIYKCLIEHRSVCSSDALTLDLLFDRYGADSRSVTIADKITDEQAHQVVAVNIGGKNYFCDPTLVRSSYENGTIPDINESVFLFEKDFFLNFIYEDNEVKYVHESADKAINNCVFQPTFNPSKLEQEKEIYQ